MLDHQPEYNQIAGQKIQRTEALADAVFAIAMTLLVLDLRSPASAAIQTEGELWLQFVSFGPKLETFFLSFLTLGIFWTGYATQYTYIAKSDRNLTWLALFFLMTVSLLPFTTGFLSEHLRFKLAIAVYWLNMLLLGLIAYQHWKYAYRNNFLSPDIPDTPAVYQAVRRRILIGQLLYAGAALLCFITTYVSIAVMLIIQLNFAIAPGFRRKR